MAFLISSFVSRSLLASNISCGKEIFIQSLKMSSTSLEDSTVSKDLGSKLAPGFSGREALGKSLHHLVPQFPQLENEMLVCLTPDAAGKTAERLPARCSQGAWRRCSATKALMMRVVKTLPLFVLNSKKFKWNMLYLCNSLLIKLFLSMCPPTYPLMQPSFYIYE